MCRLLDLLPLNSNRNERLRGGGPLRGHCVAHPILKFLASGMTKSTTTTTIGEKNGCIYTTLSGHLLKVAQWSTLREYASVIVANSVSSRMMLLYAVFGHYYF